MASTAATPADSIRSRAIRLARYLHDLVDLRWAKVRDCSKYDLVWTADVPPGEAAGPDVWLSIRKAPEPSLGPVPDSCLPWCDHQALRVSGREPSLAEALALPEEHGGGYRYLRDEPRVQEVWLQWLISDWQPWAERHRGWEARQKVYDHLLEIYRKKQKLAEEYEVLLGVGLLSWLSPSGQHVRRHVLAAQAQLAFDPGAGLITAGPRPDGAGLRLELDMLEPSEHPLPAQIEDIETMVSQSKGDPFAASISGVLTRVVHALDGRGHYHHALDSRAMPGNEACIEFAPALILRRRGQRSVLKLFDDIAGAFEQGGEIPAGFRRLCSVERQATDVTEVSDRSRAPLVPILFPLPTNHEQLRVAEQLERSHDVLVQGPPGTGKTWTIANLLCHLLAQGKRVLVTSQTPRALRVLKDKLPEQIQPLCVSVLDEDATGTKDLQSSVAAIVRRYHDCRTEEADRPIAALELEWDQIREDLQAARNRLIDLRERETRPHSIAGTPYQGTAETIGRSLEADASEFGWIEDDLPPGVEPPITGPALRELWVHLRDLSPGRIAELGLRRPDLDDLLAPDDFSAQVEAERGLYNEAEHGAAMLGSARARELLAVPAAVRAQLAAAARLYSDHIGRYRAAGLWQRDCLEAVLSGVAAPWAALRDRAWELATQLRPDAVWADAHKAEVPEGADPASLRADLRALCRHLDAGGRMGWWIFRPRVVARARHSLRRARMDGLPATSTDRLRDLHRFLNAHDHARQARELWVTTAPLAASPLLAATEGELQARAEVLGAILAGEDRLGREYRALAEKIAGAPVANCDPDQVSRELRAIAQREELASLRASFQRLGEHLAAARSGAHPVLETLVAAVASRSPDQYRVAFEIVAALEQADRHRLRDEQSLCRLATVAPLLAEDLRSNPGSAAWNQRVGRWEASWAWARARAWLAEFAQTNVAELQTRLEDLEAREHSVVAQLAAARAWQQCFATIRAGTSDYLQYLQAWAQEVRLLGRGTGPHAARHRRNAQQYLEKARPAIPAWVMPFYRVAESVEPKPGIFDVAIIDEASQSGPEALALYYLARQVLVVGDDQQISPQYVGQAQAEEQALLQRHLDGFELRDTFSGGYSLFDHAALRAPGRIVLREHFRSMPEIIRFSSDLCYSTTPLLPLRRFSRQRLPPLVAQAVPGGFREGDHNPVNKPEAEAVAAAVQRCCADPAYAGKTMGVISLLGEAQAELIDRLLRARIEARELDSREIACGDAYAFQGSERDVMFLSMVVANNLRFRALTTAPDRRRYNVAASRARDQSWLFHSVDLGDLKSDDLRRRLLEHHACLPATTAERVDWGRCGSEFEREVGRFIAARGYRLIPQFEPFGPNDYRIDFVVDNGPVRLAVECDGDHWHGPERYEHDMFRQRQLERAGWRFWRVFASAFYRDQEAAMQSLWEELEAEFEELSSPPVAPAQAATALSILDPQAIPEPVPSPARSEVGGNAPIGSLSSSTIREALRDVLASGPMYRDRLLRSTSARLGYSRVGRLIAKRLNQQVGAELRIGNIRAEGDRLAWVERLADW